MVWKDASRAPLPHADTINLLIKHIQDYPLPVEDADCMRVEIGRGTLDGGNAIQLRQDALEGYTSIRFDLIGSVASGIAFTDLVMDLNQDFSTLASHSIGLPFGGASNWLSEDNQGVGTYNALRLNLPVWELGAAVFLYDYTLMGRRSGSYATRANVSPNLLIFRLAAGNFANSSYVISGVPPA